MAGLGGDGPVNELRREVLAHARLRAGEAPGLFSLTVPTGGGKTLASLGFALEHARTHELRRLVHVIPFTSIVEQTAGVFRGVFEDVLSEADVLEHHSTFDWDAAAEGDDDEAERLRRAAQSWDAPIVVTTAVQFFESLFANRKRRCRKLNALAGSVIVLDEAQTLPLKLLRPCLAALRELTSAYGASVVLCTATQPGLRREDGFPDCPQALEDVREIAPDPPRLYQALRRAEVRDVGPQDDAALAAWMRGAPQVLTIVDNRTQARRLFDAIADAEGARHLSTLMTPAHRRSVLDDVRGRLADGLPVRLAATSLVEAGVDVDFPLVMRAASGIDRVAQAAGRCNREGRMAAPGEVLVFRPEHRAPPELKSFAEVGEAVLTRHDDPLSLEAVAAYFRALFHRYGVEALDRAEVGSGPDRTVGILAEIEATAQGLQFPFADIAAAFRIIEDGQRAVILRGGRWGMPEGEMARLTDHGPGALARGAQGYAVNVPHAVWKGLWAAGAVGWWRPERFDEQFAVVEANEGGLYDDRAGLAVEGFEEAGFLVV
jgi:CRISPR-associated endonuclease/helicase Cas3